MYMKAQGLARENLKKQKRRKWVRYEREYSMSAGHIDWHERDGTDIKVCVVLDDASRMILASEEFPEINTENSKLIIDQLLRNTGGLSLEGAHNGSWKRAWNPSESMMIAAGTAISKFTLRYVFSWLGMT
jgi:transposase InsO family protein